ncbi:hypothetical protein QFZ78_004618 [Paenibacillus sp. V4I5]|nr:hypothetical protein [Paenibacillus sp. V4I5]
MGEAKVTGGIGVTRASGDGMTDPYLNPTNLSLIRLLAKTNNPPFWPIDTYSYSQSYFLYKKTNSFHYKQKDQPLTLVQRIRGRSLKINDECSL